jgi:hypothetical protein
LFVFSIKSLFFGWIDKKRGRFTGKFFSENDLGDDQNARFCHFMLPPEKIRPQITQIYTDK